MELPRLSQYHYGEKYDLALSQLVLHQIQSDHEASKFEVSNKTNGRLTGTYHFDSFGSAQVYSRNIEIQLAMLLGLGFDFVKMQPITTNALADQKPRYRDLADRNIPMFYLMQLRKSDANFISSIEGVVQSIRLHDSGWIVVVFSDSKEILVPMFSNWDKVKPDSHLVLHETHREEVSATMLNCWIIDGKEKVTGGQLVARKQ